MLEKMRARTGLCLCWIIALSACSNGKVPEFPKTSANSTPIEGRKVHYLDAKNPTLLRAIVAADKASTAGFVQVEIVDVQNPKGYAATFRVDYQDKAGKKTFLGTFSLYPSNNPGKFIVATQGNVKDEGAILISLVVPDDYKAGDVFKAGLAGVEFVTRQGS